MVLSIFYERRIFQENTRVVITKRDRSRHIRILGSTYFSINAYRWRSFVSVKFPYGLAVRIPGFHPGGPGSTPGMGMTCSFCFQKYGERDMRFSISETVFSENLQECASLKLGLLRILRTMS